MNLTKLLQYGSEKTDQYLLRMYNQSKDITGSFCAKAPAADGAKEGLAARATRAVKGVGLEIVCRAERAAALILLAIAVAPQVFFLPIAFVASAGHLVNNNPVSRCALVYLTLIYKELCVLGELLPSMFAPAFKPTFIPANAATIAKKVAPKEQYQIFSSIAWRSSYASYKQAKLLQSNLAGVPKDSYKALDIFEELAGKGNAKAHYRLGLSYQQDGVFAKDLRMAFKHLRKASENGLGKASRKIALNFQDNVFRTSGENTKQNWFKKGAEQGDRYSQYSHSYYNLFSENSDTARQALKKFEEMTTWDTQEAVFAADNLAEFYSGTRSPCTAIDPNEAGSEAKGIQWAKKLLNEELILNEKTKKTTSQKTSGAVCLAGAYEKRFAKTKADPKAYAAEWPQMIEDLKKSETSNLACLLLGRIYYEGILVKADVQLAEKYLKRVPTNYGRFKEVQELLNKIQHPIGTRVPLFNRRYS